MKFLMSAIFIVPVALASSSSSFAATPAPGIQTTAVETVDVDKKTYLDSQTTRMARWRQDIDDFDGRVETETTQAGRAAKLELASAWTSVERASAALGMAGGDDWTSAKASYERAVGSLEAIWAKFDPRKK